MHSDFPSYLAELLDDSVWEARDLAVSCAVEASMHADLLSLPEATRTTLTAVEEEQQLTAQIRHVEAEVKDLQEYMKGLEGYLWWLPLPPKWLRQKMNMDF